MKNIFLKNNKGFKWFSNENIFVKGYFFDAKNNFYKEDDLISFFSEIKDENKFISKIKEANGTFSVIIKLNKKIYIASDTTRIFPIFYYLFNNELVISDDINFLKNSLGLSDFNNQSLSDFKSCAHTIGNLTLLNNVFQVQSNEYIIFNENSINKQGFFFSYSTDNTNKNSYNKQKEQAELAFENTFKRLISSLKGRHVALPLSGGYDSRFIATMLKKHNYKNVTCFTYGKKNNLEVKNARETAKKLNFKWVFIEYTDQLISNSFSSESFKDYLRYVGKFSSMPFWQEYFAVKHLTENKNIPSNSIFIPGHSGDLIGGSQLIKVINENIKTSEIENLILAKKFSYTEFDKSKKREILKNICTNLKKIDANFKDKFAYSAIEDYDIKEKIAKFIFNSSSVYTYFGYEHRFPFWDKELLSFFKDVPFKYKKMKILFDDVLKETYFAPFGLNFEKEIQTTFIELIIQKIKNKIKPLLPHTFKIKKQLQNDSLNSKVIINEIIKSLKKNKLSYNKNFKDSNELLIQWYLYYSQGFIK